MYSILVCDDEKDIVSALKIYLMADGYQVFEAYNGKEALEVLKEQDIHLVLMDIMMPEMDGIAAMVKIRETSNVPVILLTAKSEDTVGSLFYTPVAVLSDICLSLFLCFLINGKVTIC